MAEKEPKGEAGSKQTPAKEQAAPKPDEISRDTIHQLGTKLDQFAESLSDNERVTLSVAFALAGRGLQTFPGAVACEGGFRIGVGEGKMVVERLSGSGPTPKLSGSLSDAFCPGGASRFSIEGLEVERPMYGAKSVAAYGAKSVAAACRTPFQAAGAKSVAAAACRTPFMAAGAKSVAAAACRAPFQAAGAKSVAAAACRAPFMAAGAKSVAAAACRTPFQAAGAKSVAAAACRTPFMAGAKSVAAACRMPGYACY
jgi:hypothetical protein